MRRVRPSLVAIIVIALIAGALWLATTYSLRAGALAAGVLVGIIFASLLALAYRERRITPRPHHPVITSGQVPTWRSRRWSFQLPTLGYGVAHLPRFDLFALLPFGLARAASPLRSDEDILVLPRSAPADARLLSEIVTSERHQTSSILDAMQARDYLPGDSPKSMHWKASAKTGSLMTKVAERVSKPIIAIAIDNRTTHARVSFADVLASAVGVAETLHDLGAQVALVGPRGELLTVGDDERDMRHTLALIEPDTDLAAELGYLDDARVVLWAGAGTPPSQLRGIPVRAIPIADSSQPAAGPMDVTGVRASERRRRLAPIASRLLRALLAFAVSVLAIRIVAELAPGAWTRTAMIAAGIVILLGFMLRSIRSSDSTILIAALQVLVPIGLYLRQFGLDSPAGLLGGGANELERMYPGDAPSAILGTLLAIMTSLLAIAFDTDLSAGRSTIHLVERSRRRGLWVGPASGTGLFSIIVLLVLLALPEVFTGKLGERINVSLAAAAVLSIAALHLARVRLMKSPTTVLATGLVAIILGGLIGALAPLTPASLPLAQHFATGGAQSLYRITGMTSLDPRVSIVQNSIAPANHPILRTSEEIYLRTAVLTAFDGRSWSMGAAPSVVMANGGAPEPSEQPRHELEIVPEDEIAGFLPVPVRPLQIAGPEFGVFFPPEDAPAVRALGIIDPYLIGYTAQPTIEDYLSETMWVSFQPVTDLSVDPDDQRRELAASIVGESTRVDEQLGELLRYFSTFDYSLDVSTPPGADPLEHFLETREGYCEQFAAAFALFANDLDIPARVAVGYAPGRPDGESFLVTSAQAHAWVEVFLDGSWITVDPTPGGPAVDRALQRRLGTFPGTLPSVGPTLSPTTEAEPSAPAASPSPSAPRPEASDVAAAPRTTVSSSQPSELPRYLALLAILCAIAAASFLYWRRTTSIEQALIADVDDALLYALRRSGSGVPEGSTETQLADSLAAARSDLAAEGREAAELLTRARYAATPFKATRAERQRARQVASKLRRES